MRARISKVGMPAQWRLTLTDDEHSRTMRVDSYEQAQTMIQIFSVSKPDAFERETEYVKMGFQS